jgi:hypothetical protein
MTVVPFNQKPAVKVTAEIDADTAALVNKFVALNQHSHNSHGPMTVDKLVRMLLEDVAAAVRDGGDSWQGAHMALVLDEHGYRAG